MQVTNFTIKTDTQHTTFLADFIFRQEFSNKKNKFLTYGHRLWKTLTQPSRYNTDFSSTRSTIWFKVPTKFAKNAPYHDSFFVLALGIALFLNLDLEFDGVVSQEIIEKNLEMKKYYNYHAHQKNIKISYKLGAEKTAEKKYSGQFFSLGLDSFHTLLSHQVVSKKIIEYLIFVDGYDIPISKKNFLKTVHERINVVAKKTQKKVAFVETNLREVSDRLVGWGQYHVSALAAVGMLLSFKTIYINGESFDYNDWGLRSGVDKLFSTKDVTFKLAAHNITREKKIRQLISLPGFDLFLENIRVCWQNILLAHVPYNCSACQKCLETKLILLALGIEKTPTFKKVNLHDLKKLRLADHVRNEWNILYTILEKNPKIDPKIIETIKKILESPGPILT